MKKSLFLLVMIAPLALANPQDNLISRLDKVNAFSAGFSQKVTSADGEVISVGTGTLAIERPNLFNWTTVEPDENILVSDGKTLWYYSPFVEQVTAMWLDQATDQTPFTLLTRNNKTDWQQYTVTQKGDVFTLTPKSQSSRVGEFVVDVKKDGEVEGFSVVEQDGQVSQFTLNKFVAAKPNDSLFHFTPPDGVELDDQRQ